MSVTISDNRARRTRLLTRQSLQGVWPALLLPWDNDDELDEIRFCREVRAYCGTGVHGIYTGGTTGEFYAQDDGTFARVAEIACGEGHAEDLPVQIGCTALSSRTVARRISIAIAAGADGIQLAMPFWLELKDDEIIEFFCRAADAAGETPLILYNTARSKRPLSPPLIAKLADRLPTLIGMKDTAALPETVAELLELVPDFAVFGGEHHLLERMQVGGQGTYSSMALLNARYVVSLYEACRAGRWEEAARLQEVLQRYLHSVLRPMVREEGLYDSAVDRVQRVAGGVNVGLRCQGPYRSATPEHVERLLNWCSQNAPELLEGTLNVNARHPEPTDR